MLHMFHTRNCRPIPCGDAGTYAHYGLFEGLIGTSIGAIHQDIRFLIKKLVEEKPQYFKNSILNATAKRFLVAHILDKFNKDMMKWRWKLIKSGPEKNCE